MTRFKPKGDQPVARPQVTWGESDYQEMTKQIEEAKKLREEWRVTAKAKDRALVSIENYWLYLQKIVVVRPYTTTKDDPMTDIWYMAVRPDGYNFYSEKFRWYEKEYDRKHYAENKEISYHDRLAREQIGKGLSEQMKITHDHGDNE